MGPFSIRLVRSSGVIGPTREAGGAISVRSTISGVPSGWSIDTSASPTPEFLDGFGRVESRVLAERVGCGFDRAGVARRERPQRVLYPIAELAQHAVGHVQRVLGDEIDPYALRADQPYHLFDRVEQALGRGIEQEMRLVEEEHELGLGEVPHLGHLLEEFGQEPEQERGIEARAAHQLVGRQDVDHAAPVRRDLQEVVDLERRLAEEVGRALVLEHQELTLDGADGGGGDVAVARRQFGRVIGDELQHRPQVLEVEQQQALFVGDAEQHVEDAGLDVVELEQPPDEQRTHLGDGRPNGGALLAEQVPEYDRTGPRRVGQAQLPGPLHESRLAVAGLGQAGEVALDVGGEDRHARRRKAFGEALQRDRLAGAGRPGDEAVPVAEREGQNLGLAALADQDRAGGLVGVGHGTPGIRSSLARFL